MNTLKIKTNMTLEFNNKIILDSITNGDKDTQNKYGREGIER